MSSDGRARSIGNSSEHRRLTGIAAALAGGAGVLALAAGPVGAQVCYPPGAQSCLAVQATIVIDDPTATPGQPLTITVSGLDPGTTASGVVDSVLSLGTTTVNQQGQATFRFTVPSDFVLGQHSVRITGTAGGVTKVLGATFSVSAAGTAGTGANSTAGTGATSTSGGRGLARTGATYAVPTVVAGAGLLATGLVLTRSVKRRRKTSAA